MTACSPEGIRGKCFCHPVLGQRVQGKGSRGRGSLWQCWEPKRRLCLVTYLTLRNPMDYNLSGFFVQGDFPGKNTALGCHALLQGIFLTQGLNLGLPHCCAVLRCSVMSCLTLFDPMDSRMPGSSVHGILQARTLEWVAMTSSRGSSHPGIKPRFSTLQADSVPAELPGKPIYIFYMWKLRLRSRD